MEKRGTRSGNLLGRFYKLRDLQSFWEKTWNLWWFHFLTQESSFLLWCWGGSMLLSCGFRREASTMSCLQGVIRGPCLSEALMCHHIECLLGSQILWCSQDQGLLLPHDPEVLWARSVSDRHGILGQSPLSQSRTSFHPEASCWAAGSLKAAACYSTNGGPGNCCSLPSQWPWRPSHWL